jgi:adenine deaminase
VRVAIISGNIVDIVRSTIYPGSLEVVGGRIRTIRREDSTFARYLLPGFVDAHVHVESSMLVPSEFARLAVRHGTVATVSDPHEIANVLGVPGVHYMIANGKTAPLKFHFGAPSCVPATSYETSGAEIDAAAIGRLLSGPDVGYLSEVMNYPGVLHGDPQVLAKIAAAKQMGVPIDGHAPGLRGEALQVYLDAGISTDHECHEYDEAREKLERGMKILIREGSAAKNFDTLADLISLYPDRCMLCSDDKEPGDLMAGHIDRLVKRTLDRGLDLMTTLRCACLNPVRHYGLSVGLLQQGDPADLIVVDDLREMHVVATYIDGVLVAQDGRCLIESPRADAPNLFCAGPKRSSDFAAPPPSGRLLNVIHAIDGQHITSRLLLEPTIAGGSAVPDPARDLLKLAVVNRYQDVPPALAFVQGFGLRHGALATSVAHDSHNIVAVGASDDELCAAVNALVESRGGLAVVSGSRLEVLPLPVAGLMSTDDGPAVARRVAELERTAAELGCSLGSPFMTLSFMALLVIPHIKLSDRGLFDGDRFAFLDVFSQ